MVNHPTSDLWEVEKAAEVRDVEGLRGLREKAGQLLARLETGREMSEKRAAESGQRDPMKFITGRSALESAITATRGMIARMDALLGQMESEIESLEDDERAIPKMRSSHVLRVHAAAFAGSAL